MLDIKEAERVMTNTYPVLALAVLLGAGTLACSTTWKPCTDGGDVKWTPPVKGNMRCGQHKDATGKYVNHGKFYQFDEKGRIAVQGEFHEGLRSGTWTQFDAEGKKIAKKWFHKNIELPGEVPRGVTDDAYLQAVQEQAKAVNAPQFQFKKFLDPVKPDKAGVTPATPATPAVPPAAPKTTNTPQI